MNITNIDKTIAIMERAKARDSVYMPTWQTPKDLSKALYRDVAETEAEFHACGNTACLAGHIAISPEWQADGGTVEYSGMPCMEGGDIANVTIAAWWGVNNSIAYAFIHGKYSFDEDIKFYPVPWKEVKAEHVLEKLHELKDLGEVAFCEKYGFDAWRENTDD